MIVSKHDQSVLQCIYVIFQIFSILLVFFIRMTRDSSDDDFSKKKEESPSGSPLVSRGEAAMFE